MSHRPMTLPRIVPRRGRHRRRRDESGRTSTALPCRGPRRRHRLSHRLGPRPPRPRAAGRASAGWHADRRRLARGARRLRRARAAVAGDATHAALAGAAARCVARRRAVRPGERDAEPPGADRGASLPRAARGAAWRGRRCRRRRQRQYRPHGRRRALHRAAESAGRVRRRQPRDAQSRRRAGVGRARLRRARAACTKCRSGRGRRSRGVACGRARCDARTST